MRVSSVFSTISLLQVVSCLTLDINDPASLQDATSLVSTGLMDYYTGLQNGQTIGMFANPYYWWEAGAAWGSMLDYSWYMQNDTYDAIIMQALLYQTGDNNDYVPLNQSTTEGNDDQVFWGLAVMSAAERNFTNPPPNQPQWLYLAQAVFNTMANRWDPLTCGGGLRWQIFKWNSGYNLKNSVSNAGLFHMGARLARYTGNQTYVQWSHQVYDWMVDVGLVVENPWHFVYDNVIVDNNCSTSTLVKLQWTYTQGLMMAGCAYLWDYTNDTIWRDRAEGLLTSASVFVQDNIIYEAACQNAHTCNNDQRSFRAVFIRFLGLTAHFLPDKQDYIMGLLANSAEGAANSCSGGRDGHTCGLSWQNGTWDGYYGLGEQMSALEVMQNLRTLDRPAPYTAKNGGSSIGAGDAGVTTKPTNLKPLHINGGDKFGGAFITAIVGVSLIASAVWLLI